MRCIYIPWQFANSREYPTNSYLFWQWQLKAKRTKPTLDRCNAENRMSSSLVNKPGSYNYYVPVMHGLNNSLAVSPQFLLPREWSLIGFRLFLADTCFWQAHLKQIVYIWMILSINLCYLENSTCQCHRHSILAITITFIFWIHVEFIYKAQIYIYVHNS